MKKENYISIETFCELHGVGESFVYSMYEYEILQIKDKPDKRMLHVEELPVLEKMVRLHNELDINPEGIQAIHHLLGQVESLQEEVAALKRKLDALKCWGCPYDRRHRNMKISRLPLREDKKCNIIHITIA